MHRYGNIEFINKLTISGISELINKAAEEENKDKLYLMYVNLLPHMKKTVTFEKFYDTYKPKTNTNKNLDTRSDEEVLDEFLKKRS